MMNRRAIDFLSLASSEVVRRVLGFLAVAYLARVLSVAEFGIVSLGFTILSYTIVISTAGLTLYGIRETARGLDKKIAGALISLRLVIAGLVFVITSVISILFIRDPVTAKLVIAFNCSLFAYAFLLEWYFQGKEAMQMVSIGKTVTAAVYLVLVLVFVKSGQDILWVAMAAVGGDFAMMLFYAGRYRKERGSVDLHTDRTAWGLMLRQSLPLGLGTMLGQISMNLAPLILALLMTNVEVGLYSAASKLIFFLLMVDRVLGVMLLPAAARLQAASPDQVAHRLGEALKWIVLTALPLCLGGMIVAEDIIRVVYGEPFLPAAGLFSILIWFLCFTMIHTIYTSGLIAVAPGKVYGRVMALGAVVYATTIVVFTRFYGLYGTVAAVVISESVTLLVAWKALQPYLALRPVVRLERIVVAAAAMVAVVVAVHPYGLLLTVGAGAIVYGASLWMLRVFTGQELIALIGRK
jgi:O-antigen/teichoic acid export membrane protein